jgi:tetratricopeptide (TPR) repeat protein
MRILRTFQFSLRFTYIISIWVCILIIGVWGCGTSSIYIPIKRPAEINLRDYRKIAVGDIVNKYGRKGGHAEDLAGEITNVLLTNELFDVLDRQHLARILDEHSLSESGIIDDASATAIGKFTGTAALVFGRIQTDQYAENVEEGKPYQDKEGRDHQINVRKGTYTVTVNIQVIDIETAKILASKSLSVNHSSRTTADRQVPSNIDQNTLYTKCIKDIASQFSRMVAPYEVQVRAAFMTDKLLPEIDHAIGLFRIGDWEEGITLLRGTISKSGLPGDVQAKAYYNLGLAETYAGQFEQGIEHLKIALSLNPTSKRIQNSIARARLEQENAIKLEEQLP